MKNVVKKADEEKESLYKLITVEDTGMYYWVCDKCCIAYFDEDVILKKGSNELCPNVIKKWWGHILCERMLSCGSEESFNINWKI